MPRPIRPVGPGPGPHPGADRAGPHGVAGSPGPGGGRGRPEPNAVPLPPWRRDGAVDPRVDDGPMVRPYVLTSGRIQPVHGRFDLITLVESTGPEPTTEIGVGPEHLSIIRLCRKVQSVAEITARLDLPAGTVRVLLGDLLERGCVVVQEPESETNMADIKLYQAVINGLRAL